jgi:hypothetical protein
MPSAVKKKKKCQKNTEINHVSFAQPSAICGSLYYTGTKNFETINPFVFVYSTPERHAKASHNHPDSTPALLLCEGIPRSAKRVYQDLGHAVEIVSSAPLSVHVAPTASGVLDSLCCIIVVCQSRHF